MYTIKLPPAVKDIKSKISNTLAMRCVIRLFHFEQKAYAIKRITKT